VSQDSIFGHKLFKNPINDSEDSENTLIKSVNDRKLEEIKTDSRDPLLPGILGLKLSIIRALLNIVRILSLLLQACL
jgi:hypothetical protein